MRMTREEALKAITAFVENYACGSDLDGLREAIEALKERSHGEWKLDGTCSECGVYSSLNKDTTYFCPNCGSDNRPREKNSSSMIINGKYSENVEYGTRIEIRKKGGDEK